MEFTTLGRTGLRVSRMGLGCGGHSRLGTRGGNTDAQAERVVHEAVRLGVNFFDTAESYGTEEILGRGLAGVSRDQVVVSTKAGVDWEHRRTTAAELRARLEASLKRLRMDYVDIYHVHGVTTDEYEFATEVLVPEMRDLQAEGKIRFIGITEAFGSDPSHTMLSTAVAKDDCWDVVMVGFNILNQTARERVFPWTQVKNIGTLGMFAIRRALTRPDLAAAVVRELVERGEVSASEFDVDDPFGFLVADGVASSLSEAAYRFCGWEPGLDVVLSGTGSIDHLEANAAAILGPPLPEDVSDRLQRLFVDVDSVSGN